tara:strand:- start:75 stop:443 length:369 start_codon:yes stop_codon:yes gene_type:complete
MAGTQPKYPDAYVKLVGEDGNAFAIMGRVTKALKRAGATSEEITQFRKEAMSSDYNHLLQVVLSWVKEGDMEEEEELMEAWAEVGGEYEEDEDEDEETYRHFQRHNREEENRPSPPEWKGGV